MIGRVILPPMPPGHHLVVPRYLLEARAIPSKPTQTAKVLHAYRDVTGRVLFWHVRVRYSDGSKKVFYLRPVQSRRDWGHPKLRRDYRIPEKPRGADAYLYRLPELWDAVTSDVPEVYWCEGESDADAVAEAGAVATSHHQGAVVGASADQADWFDGFRGVVLLAVDRDVSGAHCAVRRRSLLVEAGLAPQRVVYVVSRAGKDVRDHLAAGYGLSELKRVKPGRVERYARQFTPAAGRRDGYDSAEWAAFAAALETWRPAVQRASAEVEEKFISAGMSRSDASRIAKRMERRHVEG